VVALGRELALSEVVAGDLSFLTSDGDRAERYSDEVGEYDTLLDGVTNGFATGGAGLVNTGPTVLSDLADCF